MILPVMRHPGRVYLDYNATTPVAECIGEAIPEWLKLWGNPSSIHQEGRGPKAMIRETRQNYATALNSSPLELVFNGGGSESNNQIIKGVAFRELAEPTGRKEIVISSVEHPAVRKTAHWLARYGFEVIEIPVSRNGHLDLRDQISDRTLLVSVMAVNNETGNIYPIQEVARRAHEAGALVHTDAVQALGKIPVDLKSWGVDFASFSAHKFHALPGIGMVYQKRNSNLEPLLIGGAQERRRRAGTENILGIASLGAMCPFLRDQDLYNARVKELRDLMEEGVQDIGGVSITGKDGPRVGSTSSLIIEGVDGETLLMNLDLKGFAVSTGAACSSGNPEPSPTLLSMGLSRSEAQSSMRVSIGWGTSKEEISKFVDVLHEVVTRLRRLKKPEVSVS